MKFTTIVLALTIASATQVNARRRHLNTIKGDESDASMSYMLSPARGSSTKSATGAPTGSPTGSPTSAPIPEPGECNSVITTGNNGNGNVFTLQKSLRCDCPGADFTSGVDLSTIKPALTVDGQGIVLNLNGYTVECKTFSESIPAVIKVLGKANTVMGPGTLKGGGESAAGINLQGGGFHTVDGVTIGPDLDEGIKIQSNDNTIINNFITEPGFDGVVIFGNDRNIIKGNKIVKAGNFLTFGIRLDLDFGVDPALGTADDNKVLDNTIISSGLEGIFVVGKRVVIQGNTIDQSGENGIKVISFGPFVSEGVIINEGVIIKDNSITNSRQDGILIEPTSLNTVIIDNTFAGNGNNDNIDDQGTGTVKAGNTPSLM